ncbi:MAG TPA: acyl-CoA synthetase [Geminicoccus sp.]|uniref:acyl-CoA synthetase n=1 Tax=Geminicoccus sp. TaxID=2024832 RepID=UPI002C380FC3|nr:acyl-CoA synthetase [Geminicoccus sp.]HWL69253.1 acyl-CoA synthetase [Geminicoccus sp.]
MSERIRYAGHPADGPYEVGLDRNAANFAPLTPLTFLDRTAAIYPERLAVVHGGLRRTYRELHQRCRRLASALERLGVQPGDTVAAMLPNTPPMLECHYGVPLAGAVLNALNTRSDPGTIAFILEHGEAKVLIVDSEFAPIVEKALKSVARPPIVIDVCDPEFAGPHQRLGRLDYEEFLASGDPDAAPILPADEWQAITLNYTSGTTGDPKGVVYHHRGAYLNAVGNVLVWSMPQHPVYLWTLPMFHCNGWCFPWTTVLQAGVNVCLRRMSSETIYAALADHGVTHLCGAPIIMSMLVNAPEEARRPFTQKVRMMTAASAPPAAVLEKMDRLGIEVTHVYGLTEVYGPAVVCAFQEEWAGLDSKARSEKLARQGVRYPVLEGLDVLDPETMRPVPRDATTLGEIMFRGHVVMRGYLKNPTATHAAFAEGWFHSGDLAVMHPDGYLEIKDRSKDIIISGGENISSIEVEGALYRHPDVIDAAVVARPDEKWGETPCAFVTLREGASVTAEELVQHCRGEIAGYKLPKTIVFGPLPKTSTGKVQKNVLRERAKAL